MKKLLFIGDIAHDVYPEFTLPGGCSLNAASRAYMFAKKECLPIDIFLAGPYGKSELLDQYLDNFSFKKFFCHRQQKPAEQLIKIEKDGEKNFYQYNSNILENFKFTREEGDWIKDFQGIAVMPFYSQASGLNQQVLHLREHKSIWGDFFDLKDFSKNIDNVRPILQNLYGANFGLSLHEHHLIEEILKVTFDLKVKCLITLGADGVIYQDQTRHRFQGDKIDHVVDTTGAGDTFLGCFLVALSWKIDWQKACELSAKEAILKLKQVGACYHQYLN